MIKGIIFDLDGTTLNTLEDIKESLNTILKSEGYCEKTYDDVRINLGRGSRNLIKDSLPKDVDDSLIDTITDKYIAKYRTHYNVETKAYDGIQELLNNLENKGIKLAVNSNKPDEFAKDLIKKHFPGNHFISIIGSRKGIPNKPDPYSANEIVEQMGFEKSEVLYIGDSESDVKTAKNAGLKCVGCLWGFRDLKTLIEAQADIIISKPEELMEHLND